MSEPERCLYTLIHAPQQKHDALLLALVHPVVQRLRDNPALDSLFFARYNQPDWQLRFRLLGRPDWIEGAVREEVASRLPDLRARGLLDAWEFATYQREWERYGGEHGMRLCEQLFFHDSLACLEVLHAEAEGTLDTTRREYTVVYTERFLDLLGFERGQRIAVYTKAFAWAIDGGEWSAADRALLEDRYRTLRDGLVALLEGEMPPIAARCLEDSQASASALREGLRDGRIRQDPVHLAWSLTHMHCNRMGLDVHTEAVLRYFACRLNKDGAVPLGSGRRSE